MEFNPLKIIRFLVIIPILLFSCSENSVNLPQIRLEESANKKFTYTNKISGFYLGNSHKENSAGYDGWTVNEKHYIKDFELYLDQIPIKRDSVKSFEYFPHSAIRTYTNGLVEEFTLLDTIDAFVVVLKSPVAAQIQFKPNLHRVLQGKNLLLSRNNPIVIISPDEIATGQISNSFNWTCLVGDFAKQSAVIVCALDSNESSVRNLATKILENYETYITRRKNRMSSLVQRNNLITDIPEITEAVAWAQISLDALITEQRGQGIWAGLPWFNNYWGRDTFISFAGALLVNGLFDEAKNILTTFSRYQLVNEKDSWLGRIPNRVTSQDIIYNTTDGTWWFVREVYEYLLYSGDTDYIKEIFPVIKRAIEGALRYRVDAHFFLVHDDADTWMDAKATAGAWSPRANRAVEIQALWYTSLQIGSILARLNDDQNLSEHWLAISYRLRSNFQEKYWNDFSYRMYDHLNADGSPDRQVRPNQIFSVYVPSLRGIEPLLPRAIAARVTSNVLEKLTYQYGVTSLWQEDRHFHPWHHYPPYYVPDEAYHNGLVWTWLAGPVISSLLEFHYADLAYELYYNESIQILDWDAIGNFSELLEALPREGSLQPQISGTVSQAWSLAEFSRNFYQDIIGFRPDAINSLIELRPEIPRHINYIATNLYSGTDIFNFRYIYEESVRRIEIKRLTGDEPVRLQIQYPGFAALNHIFTKTNNYYFADLYDEDRRSTTEFAKLNWYFAQPELKDDLDALKGPDYPVLTSSDYYLSANHQGKLILNVLDASGDDKGEKGNYVYPLSHHFPDGIFDLTSFELYDLGEDWGIIINLRKLYDPSWHPEYGFQGTFLALAIHNPKQFGSGKRDIGRQSGYQLSKNRSYHHIVFVGGGVDLEDRYGKTIAQIIPDNAKLPLGDINRNQIRFKISKHYLPYLNTNTVITILCGGQDDHGGAGIGDFRAVKKIPGEWHGGGAVEDKNANRVYDILQIN